MYVSMSMCGSVYVDCVSVDVWGCVFLDMSVWMCMCESELLAVCVDVCVIM